LTLAIALTATRAEGGELPPLGHRRARPENANALPGAAGEEYPKIGPAQQFAIAREILASSLSSVIQRPIGSTSQVIGRAGERISVRARELTTLLGSATPHWAHKPGDGQLFGPFGSPPMPARLTLLPSSEASVQGLLELIATARSRVDLMIYGWEDDPTGREVAGALQHAASRGVEVRLIVDRAGFLIHNAAAAVGRPTFLDSLRATRNVSVFEPPNPFVRFDHRKLAVIDGRIAWSGGMILTEVARRSWENLTFLAEGPVVDLYSALFETRWREVGGPPSGPASASALDHSLSANATVRLIRTDLRDRSLKEAIFHAIDHAQHHIYLENCYFSDEVLAAKLVEAQRRGVDVRAVVTLRGNVKRLNRYVVLTANRLLRGGVRVYLAPGMTHVKAMSADGVWSYIGTGNFDELSLRNNSEVGLSVLSPDLTRMLEDVLFRPDIERAEELRALLPLPVSWPLLELFDLWY
jgi:cardiolipin synthase